MAKKYRKRYQKYNRYARKTEIHRATGAFVFAIAVLCMLVFNRQAFQVWTNYRSIIIALPEQTKLFFLAASIAVVMMTILAIIFFTITDEHLVNKGGYVFHPFRGYIHRRIAARYLGRRLKWNEDVHHINGNTRDNYGENLCVIDRKDHRAFHRWLSDEKKRLGRYPHWSDQIHVLHRFNGRTFF